MTAEKKKYLSVKQQYEIDQLLTKFLVKGADGLHAYTGGASDHNIAVRCQVKLAQVQNRRRQIFGEIKSDNAGKGAFTSRVAGIEKRLGDTQKTVEDLEARVRSLEDAATTPRAEGMPLGSNSWRTIIKS